MRPTITMASNPTWLFTKDGQSVWMTRTTDRTLIISGPARCRRCYEFEAGARLLAFLIALADQLSSTGWRREGVNVDRRSGGERRSPHRPHWGAERRTPATAAKIEIIQAHSR